MKLLNWGLALLALGLVGCGPAPGAAFVRDAQRLHDGALASAVTRDADLRDYVQLVGERLVHAAAPERGGSPVLGGMQFHLVACDIPNVFTTGGSHAYVYDGLFRRCQAEDDLAAAMAHAYAHAIALDVEHVGIEPDPNRPLPRLAWAFASHRFTLAQERAADRLAFELYTRAGYDPAKFGRVFVRLAAEAQQQVAPMPDRQSGVVREQNAGTWAASSAPRVRRPLPVADPQTFVVLRRQASTAARPTAPAGGPAETFLRAFPNCLLPGDTPEQLQAQQQLRPPPPPPVRLEPS